MTTRRWLGHAPAIAQVRQWLFGGTWEADDVVIVTNNGKAWSMAGGSTTTTTVIDNVVAAYNLLDATGYPEFSELTASRSGNNFVLTADTEGVPFSVTVTTTEAGGGAADDQTIDGGAGGAGTDSTTSSGPNDLNIATNWSGGALPINSDDVIFDAGDADCLYNLDALSAITVTNFRREKGYTGLIGLPERNASGYDEWRATEVTIGATNVWLDGGQRIKLNTGAVQTAVVVNGSDATLEENVPTVLWRGTHASNTVDIRSGDVGIGFFYGSGATVSSLRISGANTTVTTGVSSVLTTIKVSNGDVTIQSAFTTLTAEDGTVRLEGSGAMTTVNDWGAKITHNSTGTITTANVGDGGELDCSQDFRAKTITTLNLYSDSTFRDPLEAVTITNPINVKTGWDQVTLEIGSDFTIARG